MAAASLSPSSRARLGIRVDLNDPHLAVVVGDMLAEGDQSRAAAGSGSWVAACGGVVRVVVMRHRDRPRTVSAFATLSWPRAHRSSLFICLDGRRSSARG
jgi:hypothetical protein